MVEVGPLPRVLIIRPGALGDSLMLLPALRDLMGKASITLVGRPPGLDILGPYVDRAMDLERGGWHRLFADPSIENPLPVGDVDVVAAFLTDSDGTIRRNLVRSLPGAEVHMFPSFPKKGERVHVATHLARCLASAGLPVVPASSVAAVKMGGLCRDRRRTEGIKRLVFHPGSGSLEKNHPPGLWVELVKRFMRDGMFNGFIRMLLLGPAEKELLPYFAENLGSEDPQILISWDTDRLLDILDSAALYVGHDSGVTHLSAMRCIRTVALFKKENSQHWAPLGPFVVVMENQVPGQQFCEGILEAARGLFSSGPREAPA